MDLHLSKGRRSNPLNPMSPDSDTDTTDALPHLTKALSLPTSNGTLNPCRQYHRSQPPLQSDQTVFYKECLKNHAAKLGGLSLDGCGEFMPSPTASSQDPSSLKCAACGCHRNFHRRDMGNAAAQLVPLMWTSSPDSSDRRSPTTATTTTTSSPTPLDHSSPFYSYPPGAHMLLGLTPMGPHPEQEWSNPHGSKRSRTKFTQEQKTKMHAFAEKLGWRMARGTNEEKMVEEFCREVGVKRNVFKVWMHNNKHRKEKSGIEMNSSDVVNVTSVNPDNSVSSGIHEELDGYQMVERKVFGSSPSS